MSPHAVKARPQSTDPTQYDIHHQTFSGNLPKDVAGWVERAAQVAKILAEDVVVRDREQKIPTAEVSLLKSSGLTRVLGPVKYGGGGQDWSVAYKVIREVAKGDGLVLQAGRTPESSYCLTIIAPSECFLDTICCGPGLQTW